MKKGIPRVSPHKEKGFGIEVLSFAQLFEKLEKTKKYSPFFFHKLEFYLILIVKEGCYRHFVDFESYSLEGGSALFVAENQVQHFTDDLLKSDGISIIFDNSYLDRSYIFSGCNNFYSLFNYPIGTSAIHEGEIEPTDFIDIAQKMYEEYSFPDSHTKTEILNSLLKVLLLKAERIKKIRAELNTNVKCLEIFMSFKNLIEKEYILSRSSRYYAEKLLISYKSLNEIVKKITNKTTKVFIDDFVMMEIKRYLKFTSLSIKEISYKTGFDESTNLVNFFKKNAGITPANFRKQF
ncbi:MAG: helix-turn-helix domain-containing protein [Bacteroidota bacterium]